MITKFLTTIINALNIFDRTEEKEMSKSKITEEQIVKVLRNSRYISERQRAIALWSIPSGSHIKKFRELRKKYGIPESEPGKRGKPVSIKTTPKPVIPSLLEGRKPAIINSEFEAAVQEMAEEIVEGKSDGIRETKGIFPGADYIDSEWGVYPKPEPGKYRLRNKAINRGLMASHIFFCNKGGSNPQGRDRREKVRRTFEQGACIFCGGVHNLTIIYNSDSS